MGYCLPGLPSTGLRNSDCSKSCSATKPLQPDAATTVQTCDSVLNCISSGGWYIYFITHPVACINIPNVQTSACIRCIFGLNATHLTIIFCLNSSGKKGVGSAARRRSTALHNHLINRCKQRIGIGNIL